MRPAECGRIQAHAVNETQGACTCTDDGRWPVSPVEHGQMEPSDGLQPSSLLLLASCY